MEHVPYAGDTPALTDLAAGHVDLGFMSLSAVKTLVDAGRLKALEGKTRDLANESIDKLKAVSAGGKQIDLVDDWALGYPLHVIMTMLGVPESDEPQMMALTQEFFGTADQPNKPARTTIAVVDMNPGQFVEIDAECAFPDAGERT